VALRPSDHPRLSRRIQRRIRNVRRRIYGWVFRCCYWTLPKLPPWFTSMLARTIVVPVTRLMFWHTAEQNLIKVYGNELGADERRQILIGVFRSLGSLLVEITGMIARRHDFYRNRIEDVAARRRLLELEKRTAKGWIGVGGHLGNWELLAAWLSWLPGRDRVYAMAKRLPNPHLNRIVAAARQRLGVHTLYRDDPPTKFVRLLRAGERMGAVSDQDVPSLPGIFIDFLGHRAYTPTGPARLALAADVPLVPMALVRKGDGFRVIVAEPIFPDRSRPKDEEVLRLTTAWSRQLEDMIHEHKDQWAWFHQRWKTTPEQLAGRMIPWSSAALVGQES
jgi:KDO2-lipid IV(A) lauroyltransferase